ncbi:hypothetical protein KR093_008547 [Drosophila rubida]|uniref:Uncharacterized protein n=1 Tax=Drosophila rubida TaxID=30044 RepID=A0AAD4KBU3_9MUSC|nr:hypothetical protein KR093_008547 [Drosophila rubida]
MTPSPTPPPPPPTATQPLQPPPPVGQNIAPTGAFPGKSTNTLRKQHTPRMTFDFSISIGSLTPGWNDPPPISADAVRRPRLDLRKRVAHPMNEPPSQLQPQPPL